MAQRVAAPLPIPPLSVSGVPGPRNVERSEALRRNKGLPAVVYGIEEFQIEVLLVYGIARYCFIVPASKCDKPENIRHASFEQLVSLLYLCLCFWSKFYVRPALRRQYLILWRIRFQLTLRITSCPECPRREYLCDDDDAKYEKENPLEKCIRQDNIVQIPTSGIFEHVFVDEEQQGHVDFLPS
jgi:hypothetical protein